MSNRELPEMAKLLIATKNNIKTRDTWYQGAMFGPGPTPELQMCVLGAVCRAAHTLNADTCPNHSAPCLSHQYSDAMDILDEIANKLFNSNIITVNDMYGIDAFESVHKCLDEAIKMVIDKQLVKV